MRTSLSEDLLLESCPERGKHDKAGRQQALIDAATRVFAEHGFDGATTREVAERAGCSEGLIHRYFGGKRGLLLAILETRASMVANSIDQLQPPAAAVLDTVRGILTSQIEAMWAGRDIMRVNVSQASIDPQVGELIASRYNDVRVADILGRLQTLRADGLVRADTDLEAVAHALSGLGFALGFWAQVAFAQDREAVRHTAIEFAAVVARGLEPESTPTLTNAGAQST
jgi:AcrR family transcriptional regulator